MGIHIHSATGGAYRHCLHTGGEDATPGGFAPKSSSIQDFQMPWQTKQLASSADIEVMPNALRLLWHFITVSCSQQLLRRSMQSAFAETAPRSEKWRDMQAALQSKSLLPVL